MLASNYSINKIKNTHCRKLQVLFLLNSNIYGHVNMFPLFVVLKSQYCHLKSKPFQFNKRMELSELIPLIQKQPKALG